MANPISHCPRCGEQVASEASECFRCHGILLGAVHAVRAEPDARRRFDLAKQISASTPGSVFSDLQRALGNPALPLLRGATRASAEPFIELLQRLGVAAAFRFDAQQTGTRTRGAPIRVAGIAILIVAAAAAGLWAHRTPPPAAVAEPGAARAEAPARAAPPAVVAEPTPAPQTGELTTQEIARRDTPSTVAIHCQTTLGSGFFVSPDVVVTNAHVLCPPGEAMEVALSDGRKLLGRELTRDENLDLGLVRVLGANAHPLSLGDASALQTGDRVAMIGSPRGMEFTLHEGKVSFVGRNYFGVAYVQLDADINPGNSGGPLLDKSGQVVGVVSMMVQESSGLGLALPVNYLYEGQQPIFGGPHAPDPGWQGLVGTIEKADEIEADKEHGVFILPGLLVAVWKTLNRGELTAVLLQRSHGGEPPRRDVTAAYSTSADSGLCTASAHIMEWKRLDAFPSHVSTARMRWIKRHKLDQDIYSAVVNFDVGHCIHDGLQGTLTLVDGDPQTNQAKIITDAEANALFGHLN